MTIAKSVLILCDDSRSITFFLKKVIVDDSDKDPCKDVLTFIDFNGKVIINYPSFQIIE